MMRDGSAYLNQGGEGATFLSFQLMECDTCTCRMHVHVQVHTSDILPWAAGEGVGFDFCVAHLSAIEGILLRVRARANACTHARASSIYSIQAL